MGHIPQARAKQRTQVKILPFLRKKSRLSVKVPELKALPGGRVLSACIWEGRGGKIERPPPAPRNKTLSKGHRREVV